MLNNRIVLFFLLWGGRGVFFVIFWIIFTWHYNKRTLQTFELHRTEKNYVIPKHALNRRLPKGCLSKAQSFWSTSSASLDSSSSPNSRKLAKKTKSFDVEMPCSLKMDSLSWGPLSKSLNLPASCSRSHASEGCFCLAEIEPQFSVAECEVGVTGEDWVSMGLALELPDIWVCGNADTLEKGFEDVIDEEVVMISMENW